MVTWNLKKRKIIIQIDIKSVCKLYDRMQTSWGTPNQTSSWVFSCILTTFEADFVFTLFWGIPPLAGKPLLAYDIILVAMASFFCDITGKQATRSVFRVSIYTTFLHFNLISLHQKVYRIVCLIHIVLVVSFWIIVEKEFCRKLMNAMQSVENGGHFELIKKVSLSLEGFCKTSNFQTAITSHPEKLQQWFLHHKIQNRMCYLSRAIFQLAYWKENIPFGIIIQKTYKILHKKFMQFNHSDLKMVCTKVKNLKKG